MKGPPAKKKKHCKEVFVVRRMQLFKSLKISAHWILSYSVLVH